MQIKLMIQKRIYILNFKDYLNFLIRKAIGVQINSKKKTYPAISFGKSSRGLSNLLIIIFYL